MNQSQKNLGDIQPQHTKSQSELRNALHNQVRILLDQCTAFDEGRRYVVTEISTKLRVLLHDKGSSKSILGQVGLKEKLRYVDSGLYRSDLNDYWNSKLKDTHPGSEVCGSNPQEVGLLDFELAPNRQSRICAPLRENRFSKDDPRHSLIKSPKPFSEWWSTPLIESSKGTSVSRGHLVLTMADKEGGAHVDPRVPANFHSLRNDHVPEYRDLGIPKNIVDDAIAAIYGQPPSRDDVAAFSIRQIAFELLLTLARGANLDFEVLNYPCMTSKYRPAPILIPTIIGQPDK